MLLAVLLAGVMLPATAAAEAFDVVGAGVRAGVSDVVTDEVFQQYELYGVFDTPWSWRPGRWVVATRVTGTLGVLTSAGDTGGLVSLGGGFEFSPESGRFTVGLGVRPTLISREKYGNDDLGGSFHFTSYLGFNYRFGQHITLGYQFSHMSNANTDDPNPGLDMHMLELGYRF